MEVKKSFIILTVAILAAPKPIEVKDELQGSHAMEELFGKMNAQEDSWLIFGMLMAGRQILDY